MIPIRIGKLALGCALALSAFAAQATPKLTPKIGITTDMSGTYSDIAGKGSAVAAEMAVEDFYAKHPEVKASVISGDHQNKTDIGSAMVRDWLDNQGVDVVAELTSSGVALAAQHLTNERDKLLLITSAGSSDLTGKHCAPNTIACVYDTFATANGTGRAMVQQGGKSWYMIMVDYTFGEALARDAMDAVKAQGGTILGTTKHPLSATDMSSQIFSAISSKADVIGLAHAGETFPASIKQAKRVRVDRIRSEASGLANVHFRRTCFGPRYGARALLDHRVLLGPYRGIPRVGQTLLRTDGCHAQHGPGRCLFGRYALPGSCKANRYD